MKVVSVSVQRHAETIEPGLVVNIVVSFLKGRELPFTATAVVRTEDRRILGVARALTGLGDKLALDAVEGATSDATAHIHLELPLVPRHLDHIEAVREGNRKNDVVLSFDFEICSLVSKTLLAYMQRGHDLGIPSVETRVHQNADPVFYVDRLSGSSFHTQTNNMFVLSGDGGRTFIERVTHKESRPATIGSGDWVHDYLAEWKSTRYVVVELPAPPVLSTKTPEIDERVNAAIAAAQKAAGNFADGDWNDIVEDMRPVWELLRNDAHVADLLRRDGYTEEAIDAFNESVKQQFTLASKFIHRTDHSKKNIAPEIKACREDAYFVYSVGLALLNLVSRKAARLAPP